MIINPSTDVTEFAGTKVVINGVRTARIHTINHGAAAIHCRVELADGVWGECWDDPHGDCRGGGSAFWWPYGTDLAVAA